MYIDEDKFLAQGTYRHMQWNVVQMLGAQILVILNSGEIVSERCKLVESDTNLFSLEYVYKLIDNFLDGGVSDG